MASTQPTSKPSPSNRPPLPVVSTWSDRSDAGAMRLTSLRVAAAAAVCVDRRTPSLAAHHCRRHLSRLLQTRSSVRRFEIVLAPLSLLTLAATNSKPQNSAIGPKLFNWLVYAAWFLLRQVISPSSRSSHFVKIRAKGRPFVASVSSSSRSPSRCRAPTRSENNIDAWVDKK